MSTMRTAERKFGEVVSDVKDDVERVADKAAGKANEAYESARKYTGEALETAGEKAVEAKEKVTELAEDFQAQLTRMIHDRPIATLAIGAGLAFALGALWKMSSPRQPAWYEMDRWRR